MKIKFITCIYDNLFGTDLGGRFNRGGHYKHSLKAIMKITVADFLLYTSEEFRSIKLINVRIIVFGNNHTNALRFSLRKI